jgi:cell division protein ZapA
MSQVTVTLNGRTFRLRCGDGEEERLMTLAAYLGERIDSLVAEFGQVGDDRLLMMAGLLITDELFDLREQLIQSAVDDTGSEEELGSMPRAAGSTG